jgi:16S rRNA (cytosine967-C5)-methyltransferase
VLLDAPCSGLGVVQRNPDIKWHRHETDLAPLALAQRRLLDRVAPLVRPGGVLVYSVCSFEPEETAMVVDDFLTRHPDFTADLLPDPLRSRFPALFTSRGFLCTLPHRHDMDGFFAARMMKRPAP